MKRDQLVPGMSGTLSDGTTWKIERSGAYVRWDGPALDVPRDSCLDYLPQPVLDLLVPDEPKPHFEPQAFYVGRYKTGSSTSVISGASLAEIDSGWIAAHDWFRIPVEPVTP